MFLLNFGLKPVFGFKPWFQTLVLTKDQATQCLMGPKSGTAFYIESRSTWKSGTALAVSAE